MNKRGRQSSIADDSVFNPRSASRAEEGNQAAATAQSSGEQQFGLYNDTVNTHLLNFEGLHTCVLQRVLCLSSGVCIV